MRLSWQVLEARLRAPLPTAHGQLTGRPLVLVRLQDERSGLSGWGEAAPLESYDGVTLADVLAALEDCRAVVAGLPGEVLREELLAECARVAVLPQAISAVDLALWDLEGRRSREPVWALLGAAAGEPVPVNATVGALDRSGAAAAALAARRDGFACLKLKVGSGDDAGRLAAVRAAAGPAMAIRLDANGCWSMSHAVAALEVLAAAGLELCEEPCHGLAEIAQVAERSRVPVALDESARLPGALDSRICLAACLKVSACGGISGVLAAGREAREAGYEVYLASAYDGPLGIAAALHAAAALRPDRHCGLATLGLFAGRGDPLAPWQGMLAPPPGPGLGDGLLSWYGR